jgi:hypothetical protein
MPDRDVALGVPGLLGVGADRVEADVGEEDVGGAGEGAVPALLGVEEGVPVRRVDVARADRDHEQHDAELQQHDRGVEAGALADADHQDDGQQERDHRRRQVEDDRDRADVPSGGDDVGGRAHRIDGERGRQVQIEEGEERLEIVRPPVRHRARRDRVLEHQVPADDPGEELAEGGVGVGVGAARDRNHRRELGVAERRERAADAGQHEREHQRRSGVVAGGETRHHEDAGADDRADAERGQCDGTQDSVQSVGGGELGLQHFDRFGGENARPQGDGASSTGSVRAQSRRALRCGRRSDSVVPWRPVKIGLPRGKLCTGREALVDRTAQDRAARTTLDLGI